MDIKALCQLSGPTWVNVNVSPLLPGMTNYLAWWLNHIIHPEGHPGESQNLESKIKVLPQAKVGAGREESRRGLL